jgi:hypothetical protein
MKKLLILAALLVGTSAYAQKEKTIRLNDSTKLILSVADDGKTKEGLFYIKNSKNDGIWVQGNYKNNERFGTWYFFNANDKTLMMRYNYDQKKLLYYDNAQLNNVSVKVSTDDQEIAKKASAPLPLCPVNYLLTAITDKLHNDHKLGLDNMQAEITAHVETDGKAIYTITYKGSSGKMKKIDVDLKDTPFVIEWLPSKYENKLLKADFTMYAVINANSPAEFSRFRWDVGQGEAHKNF